MYHRVIPAILLLLSGDATEAKVKNPAGVAAKGGGLHKGFIETFPEYALMKASRKSNDYDRKHLGDAAIKGVDLFSFGSKEPEGVTREGKVYLSFSLKIYLLESVQAANAALDSFKKLGCESCGPGHSYAWDFAFTDGKRLYWLAAPCLFSDANFLRMSAKLSSVFPKRSKKSVMCRCGFGCEWIDSQSLK
jgi:hypothetical protein